MRIEIGQVITQIISFLVMFWVLKRYGWKPLLNVLEQRKNKIQSAFDAIETQKQEISQLKEEAQKERDDVKHYAAAKLKERVEEEKASLAELKKKAENEARALISKTQQELKNEILKAKEDLKNEISTMVVLGTEKLLKTKIDEQQQAALLSDFIEQMEPK